MRVWLLTIGEPVPVNEGSRDRLHRTGYLAHLLADCGHDVIWWTSTFDHFRKKHMFENDATLHIGDKLEIRLLHGMGYQRNISLARFIDHWQIANKFTSCARQERKTPDVILSAFPTIELSAEAVRYGRERVVPVVLDMRDMWPDIFADHVPYILRPIINLLLYPLFLASRNVCSEATSITGHTDAFVEWGLRRGKRSRSYMDKAFPMGYISAPPESVNIQEAEHYWDEMGILAKGNGFIVCFIGSIGHQLDLDSVILAARMLRKQNRKVRFIICGDGDMLSYYREMTADDPNISFPGWIDKDQIFVLMRRSFVGIDPLPDRYDFLSTINNKAIEYMSAGLPVISTPNKGVLHDFLSLHQCGMSCPTGQPDKLALSISYLLDNKEELKRMSENALNVYKDYFVAEKVYLDMMNYLQDIVTRYQCASRDSMLEKEIS